MAAKVSPNHIGQAGQNLLRILIASYFIAVAIGLIAGTDATPLASVYLAPEPAALLGRSAFFILGYLVMTGIWLRPAAMLLGIIMFWSSYILHFGPGATGPLGDFWRDLALVGALMLTYARLSPRGLRRSSMIRWTRNPQPADLQQPVAPKRVAVLLPSNVTRLQTSAERAAGQKQTENIFRNDLNDLLAS